MEKYWGSQDVYGNLNPVLLFVKFNTVNNIFYTILDLFAIWLLLILQFFFCAFFSDFGFHLFSKVYISQCTLVTISPSHPCIVACTLYSSLFFRTSCNYMIPHYGRMLVALSNSAIDWKVPDARSEFKPTSAITRFSLIYNTAKVLLVDGGI